MLRKMFSNRMFQLGVALAVTVGVVAACGSSSNPMSPSSSGTIPTVTVTGAGVSPTEVRVSVGGRVRFVNNDTVNRQINLQPVSRSRRLSADQRGRRVDPWPEQDDRCPLSRGHVRVSRAPHGGAASFLGVILVGESASSGDAPPTGY